jgi:hypothetical protein
MLHKKILGTDCASDTVFFEIPPYSPRQQCPICILLNARKRKRDSPSSQAQEFFQIRQLFLRGALACFDDVWNLVRIE